jgi:hypothetical protein
MAGQSGGALGWTLLGFLAGVAATLGLQILMGGAERTSLPHAAAKAQVVILPPAAPQPKPVKKPVKLASSGASAAAVPAAVEPADQVADDAAAAGMTSRVSPSAAPTGDQVPTGTVQ